MTMSRAWYLGLAAVVFSIGALGLLVRRNVLVMFMCVELMLNAANLTFVTFSRMLNDIGGQAARVLHPGGGRRRGGGGPRHRRGPLPPPPDLSRRRLPRYEGLHRRQQCSTPTLTLIIALLPLAGFVVLAAFGRRLGDPWAGWLGTATVLGSFVVACVVYAGLLDSGAGPFVHPEPFTWIPVGGLQVKAACWSTRCR